MPAFSAFTDWVVSVRCRGAFMLALGLELPVPDHTTLARHRRGVAVEMNAPGRQGPVDLMLDSTVVTFQGPGEWDRLKHGEKCRVWRKLHLAVDAGTGEILAHELTNSDTANRAIRHATPVTCASRDPGLKAPVMRAPRSMDQSRAFIHEQKGHVS
jgi:hypothetical protein